MRIYTRQGDLGETSLPGGERIGKDDPRTEAYGTLDELNASVGLLLTCVPDTLSVQRTRLKRIQCDLYNAACHLAGTGTAAEKLPVIAGTRIDELEQDMDEMTAIMPELTCFVLPEGCTAAAQAHVTRTVCRRAERRLVGFIGTLPEGGVGDALFTILRYMNRLSDYLFVLARYANHVAGRGDTPWVADT